MSADIKAHLANDLEQSAAMLDSREFDAVQLDNCASMMRYAATVIRQALANDALDKLVENAKEFGLSYEQPVQRRPMSRTNNLWAPLVIGSRKPWIVWCDIRSTRHDAKAAYLEGCLECDHKNMLKRVKFVKVFVAVQEKGGGV